MESTIQDILRQFNNLFVDYMTDDATRLETFSYFKSARYKPDEAKLFLKHAFEEYNKNLLEKVIQIKFKENGNGEGSSYECILVDDLINLLNK